jgi:hypothetical protein
MMARRWPDGGQRPTRGQKITRPAMRLWPCQRALARRWPPNGHATALLPMEEERRWKRAFLLGVARPSASAQRLRMRPQCELHPLVTPCPFGQSDSHDACRAPPDFARCLLRAICVPAAPRARVLRLLRPPPFMRLPFRTTNMPPRTYYAQGCRRTLGARERAECHSDARRRERPIVDVPLALSLVLDSDLRGASASAEYAAALSEYQGYGRGT